MGWDYTRIKVAFFGQCKEWNRPSYNDITGKANSKKYRWVIFKITIAENPAMEGKALAELDFMLATREEWGMKKKSECFWERQKITLCFVFEKFFQTVFKHTFYMLIWCVF